MSAETPELWNQYNLIDNPDPGGGILYALRYSPEHISAAREALISAIGERGVTLSDHPEGGIVVELPEGTTDESMANLGILFEELGVLNEASEYQAALNNINTVPEMAQALESALASGGHKLGLKGALLLGEGRVDYYNFVTIGVPQIINELLVAHIQNKVLSKKDIAALRSLERSQQIFHRMVEGIGARGTVVMNL